MLSQDVTEAQTVDEWLTVVIPGVRDLAESALPTLAGTFGSTLGYVTVGWWISAAAALVSFLDGGKAIMLVFLLLAVLLPFGLALPVSNTCAHCAALRRMIESCRPAGLDEVSEAAASQLAELEKHLEDLSPSGASAGADNQSEATVVDAGTGGSKAPLWLQPWALVSFLVTANSWVYVPEAAPLVRA